jgi:ribonuclease HI
LHDAGYEVSMACQHCEGHPPETLLHFFWGCPSLKNIEDQDIHKSSAIRVEAIEEAGESPGLWLRGLCPMKEMRETLADDAGQGEDEMQMGQTFGDRAGATMLWIGTDGSGGKVKDDRIQKCGWGLTAYDQNFRLRAAIGGRVGTGGQTVPRAELTALCVALESAWADVDAIIYIDSSYVVNGWRHMELMKTNTDLGWRCFAAKGARSATTAVRKVKSHIDKQDLLNAREPLHAFFLNETADEVAGAAAIRCQTDEMIVRQLRAMDEKTSKIQRRLVAVAMFRATQEEPGGRRELRPKTCGLLKRRQLRHTALAQSQHTFSRQGQLFKCTKCFKSSGARKLLSLTRTPCIATIRRTIFQDQVRRSRPQGGHASHNFHRHRGVWFCMHCWSYTVSRLYTLARPCTFAGTGLSEKGQWTKNRFAKGLPPSSLRRWPE